MNIQEFQSLIDKFNTRGKVHSVKPINSGHINTTFKVETRAEKVHYYTLQRINKYVFTNPPAVMNNVLKVTNHIKKRVEQSGGNIERDVLTVVLTKDGKPYHLDDSGEYWRIYNYICNAHTLDHVKNPEDLYRAGYGFGTFQKMLADFPMADLFETIPGFHDTPVRYNQLMEAAEKDVLGRAKSVKNELDFFIKRKNEMSILTALAAEGKMPLRVVHNDTKFNNILIDDNTDETLSVIDLDTVMPGLTAYDFGDAIRFAANTALEDEADLSLVSINMQLYESFTKGFLTALDGGITKDEIAHFPWGAKIITMELAMRFLADHINGDLYFKIHRTNHNLDRARCQIELVRSMEENFDEMINIVNKFI